MKIFVQENSGAFRVATREEIFAAADAEVNKKFRRGAVFSSTDAAREIFSRRLVAREHEVFAAAWLDNHHRLIAFEELSTGTIDAASVHPREAVKAALAHNAAAVVVGHNHPSGVSEPSQADLVLTRRLKDALALVDVRLLDHVIVAADGAVSLAERGGF